MGVSITISVGRLGADAIAKPVGDKGTTLFTFSVASDVFTGNQSQTEWDHVKFFCPTPKYTDVLKRRLVKGAIVVVYGSYRTDTFNDGEGNEVKAKRLYADVVKVISEVATTESENKGQASQRGSPDSTAKTASTEPSKKFIDLPQ